VPRKKVEAAVVIGSEPQEVPEAPRPLVGQRAVVEYFKRLGLDNLAHAYLFHGPRGVGKKTFARTLALRLHCERPTSFPLGFCGQCGSCRRGIAGTSGDTIVVDDEFVRSADALAGKLERKTSDIGIEASRRMIALMQLKSYEGGRLIAIVPDFDRVTGVEAYNAILKELEEPDPGKLFLITSEHPNAILETIRSRTVMVRFEPLSDDEIAKTLSSEYGQARERAKTIARRAQGSLGDAIDELDDEGASLRQAARAWLLACLRSPEKLPPMPAFDADDRETARWQLDEVLRQARLTARDLLVTALGSKRLVFDTDASAEYEKTVDTLGPAAVQRLSAAFDAIDEAARIAGTNVAPGATFGWLQVQLRSL